MKLVMALSNHKNLIHSLISLILLMFLLYYFNTFSKKNRLFLDSQAKVTGLILARCGSKGIKLKNLSIINGKSLLGRTLDIMFEFGQFNEIWVSTDCQEISNEVKKHGALVHWRDKETASDNAPSILAVEEFLQKHDGIDVLALLQSTSPFIKVSFLDEAFNKIVSGEYDSVFSVTRQYKLIWSLEQGGTINPENFELVKRPRRQDWSGQLVETGMFYFFRTGLVASNVLQGGRIGYVEVPANHSLEIDTEFDLQVARAISKILEGSDSG